MKSSEYLNRPAPSIQTSSESGISTPYRRFDTIVSAGVAGVVSTFLGYPFDTVKVRLQIDPRGSVWHCFTRIYKEDKLRGFVRGIGPPLVSITFMRTLSFSVYTEFKESLSRISIGKTQDIAKGNDNGLPMWSNIAIWAASGACAGAIVAMIACPFEFAKLSSQLDPLVAKDCRPRGSIASIRHIIHTRGMGGLYSGFGMHFLRDTLGTSIYFPIYEAVKKAVHFEGPCSSLGVAFAGACCGLASWAIVFPIDTMKSMVQKDILANLANRAYKSKLVFTFNRKMYRGLGVSVIRIMLVHSAFFATLEAVKG